VASVVLLTWGTDPPAAGCLPGGELRAGGESELGEDVPDVGLDGALADVLGGGDLAIGQSLSDVGGDLFLSPG
jgi:hypothetical protein